MAHPAPRPDHQPLIEQMQLTVARWEAAGDARAIFLSCYNLMTQNVMATVDTAEFHDPVWVAELLQHFATYYFAALDAYERHDAGTPTVWQFAFDSAGSAESQAVQILLLGVNAHINFDLVLTLVDILQPEWETLSAAQRKQRYEDHCQVNAVIGRTIDAVQDQIIERAAPDMGMVDTMLGPLDEWATSHLLSHWREEVWQNAQKLLAAADTAEKEALRLAIEAKTLQRANAILLNQGILALRHLL